MDTWYKNAIFYGIEIKTFYDGDGNGIGDFTGLTEKLDYLDDLGITCIWLLPFYPSGDRDNGYDVTDYYNVDPDYGTLEDFRKLMQEAKKHHIRVIIDLVVHHTSNLHPWFQASQKDKNSIYRNFYVWSEEIPEGNYPESKTAFPEIEAGVWRYDGISKSYYFHRFYHFEPDLNTANPDVQKEIFNIIDFWLQFGIDGFRVDAATMLFERKGKEGTKVENPDIFMESMSSFIRKKNRDAILLAEADVTPDRIKPYFGKGNRMQLLYNFLLNRYIFLALARGDARPIKEELQSEPVPPQNGQWVNFLRNLDELNLQQLPEFERKETLQVFAPDPGMRVYDRGIRRRLAPMFNGDIRRLKMAYSLIFSLPGAALIVYGEEIGMGDNLQLPEREAVRIPMQWVDTKNAGFSSVNPEGLIRDVLSKGPYRYQKLNVKTEQGNTASLFNHIKHLCKIRKEHQEIGHGEYELLDTDPGGIYAISYTWPKGKMIAIHNLAQEPYKVRILNQMHLKLEDFFSDGKYNKNETSSSIPINGYGYRWFIVIEEL